MCGPCFASCSYVESEIASDAKAMLSFLMAAKKPDVTLCKMCCHMDMNAVSDTWDGIAQCPSEMTAKARHEMGCDTWDFLVSCTCEKDFWRDLEGQNNVLRAVLMIQGGGATSSLATTCLDLSRIHEMYFPVSESKVRYSIKCSS